MINAAWSGRKEGEVLICFGSKAYPMGLVSWRNRTGECPKDGGCLGNTGKVIGTGSSCSATAELESDKAVPCRSDRDSLSGLRNKLRRNYFHPNFTNKATKFNVSQPTTTGLFQSHNAASFVWLPMGILGHLKPTS